MFVMNSRREGFALAGAVLAMVLVGAIVTGGFYAANQESQITRSAETSDLAQYIAEVGLENTVGRTTLVTLEAITVGNSATVSTNTAVAFGGTNVGTYTATVTRITAALFVVRSTGTVSVGGANSGAQRTVSTVMKLRNVDMDNNTAMQVFGNLEVGGNSNIDGDDVRYGGWTGCTTQSSTSAVVAQPGATVRTRGNGNIDGAITRQSMTIDNFTVFGDMTWDELVRLANITYTSSATPNPQPSLDGVTCRTSDTNNWGEPLLAAHACYSYFPIIYAAQNMTIQSNGYGQGILLVRGDLDIQGTFRFYGPVVVYGRITMAGTADIFGSVMAFGGGAIDIQNNLGTGTSVVQYSSCAIERAVEGVSGLSRGVPIRNRAFFDLTSVQNSY